MNNNEIFKEELHNENITINDGTIISPFKVQSDLKKRGYSDESINRIVFYSKLGYLNNCLGQNDSVYFEKTDELIKLEKRVHELLEKGFSIEDVIFTTIIGMLMQDDLTIKKELEESKEFRNENASEISALYDISFPYEGTSSLQTKYLNYKRNKLKKVLKNYYFSSDEILYALNDSSLKQNNSSSYENERNIKKKILKEYYEKEKLSLKDRIEIAAKTTGIVAAVPITVGAITGSLCLLSKLPLEQTYTLVTNNPEAVALGGVVVFAVAGLAAVGFSTDIIGYDIGGRTK